MCYAPHLSIKSTCFDHNLHCFENVNPLHVSDRQIDCMLREAHDFIILKSILIQSHLQREYRASKNFLAQFDFRQTNSVDLYHLGKSLRWLINIILINMIFSETYWIASYYSKSIGLRLRKKFNEFILRKNKQCYLGRQMWQKTDSDVRIIQIWRCNWYLLLSFKSINHTQKWINNID